MHMRTLRQRRTAAVDRRVDMCGVVGGVSLPLLHPSVSSLLNATLSRLTASSPRTHYVALVRADTEQDDSITRTTTVVRINTDTQDMETEVSTQQQQTTQRMRMRLARGCLRRRTCCLMSMMCQSLDPIFARYATPGADTSLTSAALSSAFAAAPARHFHADVDVTISTLPREPTPTPTPASILTSTGTPALAAAVYQPTYVPPSWKQEASPAAMAASMSSSSSSVAAGAARAIHVTRKYHGQPSAVTITEPYAYRALDPYKRATATAIATPVAMTSYSTAARPSYA